ncbi:MAG: extracellular solute-binding protein [Oscillospiraceae bacterium]|nr:extracellular solute-binding protein [Oscillospiraceae bacterium]
MKKILALILCVVMAFSLLSACGGEGGKVNNTDANGKVTLTIGIPKHTSVSDYDNNHYTKWLEEKTGYEIKFQFFATGAGDYKTQMSTMVAGNVELPDIMMGFDLGSDLYNRYGSDGIFVDLADLFNDREKSAIWWEQFEKLDKEYADNIWRRMHTTDGSEAIYAFPEIQQSTIDVMSYTPWINQQWLDYLQLEMPTDPDSLYNVLVAFRDKDPNQNGLPDEIPLIGTAGNLSGNAINWIINMFIYSDLSTNFNVDENGKLYSPYREDAYREALKYIAKLYKEGLLSPLTLTATPQEIRQMVCPSEGGVQIAGIAVTHLTVGFVEGHTGILSYEPVPLWGNAIVSENQNYYSTFITKDCENVEAAWKLLMTMCTEESAIIQRYGIQGENWDYAPEGSTSIMGNDAVIRVYNDVATTIGSENWRNVEATFLFNAEGEGNQAVPEEETEVRTHKYELFNKALNNYAQQMENHNPDKALVCPLLVWPDEYKEEVPYARDDCRSYITRARTDFITGEKNINDDGDWQDYLKELDELGFDRVLFYSQAIYEETISQ